MTNKTKNVSIRYAKKEFFSVGLVLIAYCLIVLYIPFLLNKILPFIENDFLNDIRNKELLVYLICVIIGTLFHFHY